MKAADRKQLIEAARAAAMRAYAPYSRFRVGAALLGASGQVHTGFNVENVSYGLSMCAERTAMYGALVPRVRTVTVAPMPTLNCDGGSTRNPYATGAASDVGT